MNNFSKFYRLTVHKLHSKIVAGLQKKLLQFHRNTIRLFSTISMDKKNRLSVTVKTTRKCFATAKIRINSVFSLANLMTCSNNYKEKKFHTTTYSTLMQR